MPSGLNGYPRPGRANGVVNVTSGDIASADLMRKAGSEIAVVPTRQSEGQSNRGYASAARSARVHSPNSQSLEWILQWVLSTGAREAYACDSRHRR